MSADATVVVCTQGKQGLLGRALAAIAGQRGVAVEIVLVTDADPAAVGALVPAGAAPLTTIVEEESRSLNRKRNRGIRAAGADLVLFTDDDCVPDEDWAATCCRALADHEVVTGRSLPLSEGYRTSIRTSEVPRLWRGRWYELVFTWRVGCGNNMGARKSAFARYGLFREDIGVGTWSQAGCDTEFFFRVMSHRRGTVYYEPRAVVRHLQSDDAEAFARKRRAYHRGISYMARRVHPGSLYAWLMALGRAGASALSFAASLLTLRRRTIHHRFYQLRGAIEGFWPPGSAS